MIRAKAGVTAVYLKALKCLVKFPREIYASLIISPSLSRLITQGKEYPRPKILCVYPAKICEEIARWILEEDFIPQLPRYVSDTFVQSLRTSPPEIFVSITRSGKGILRKRSPPSSVKFLPMARGEDSLRLSVDAYHEASDNAPAATGRVALPRIDMQKHRGGSERRSKEADECIIWPSTASLVPADVAQRLTRTPRTPVSTRRVNICLALVR